MFIQMLVEAQKFELGTCTLKVNEAAEEVSMGAATTHTHTHVCMYECPRAESGASGFRFAETAAKRGPTASTMKY